MASDVNIVYCVKIIIIINNYISTYMHMCAWSSIGVGYSCINIKFLIYPPDVFTDRLNGTKKTRSNGNEAYIGVVLRERFAYAEAGVKHPPRRSSGSGEILPTNQESQILKKKAREKIFYNYKASLRSGNKSRESHVETMHMHNVYELTLKECKSGFINFALRNLLTRSQLNIYTMVC